MSRPTTTAAQGSVSIAGDNAGNVVNVNAGSGSTVNVQLENRIARELPSFLSAVIVLFSRQRLSEYGLGARRELPPAVIEKINHNNLSPSHQIIIDYRRHSIVLERSYHGVEQQNDDARYLVRRKAAVSYQSQLQIACSAASIPVIAPGEFARSNAAMLVGMVIDDLLNQYKLSNALMVEQETAHLAISLIVADAIIECDVLERPEDVVAA